MKRLFIYITVVIGITGCQMFDMTKAESEKIIGKIYWINLHIPEDPGYFLIFRENDKADHYLLKPEESLVCFKGNDSVLLVKAKVNPTMVHYKIIHNQGEQILSVKTLKETEYDNYINTMCIKYEFVIPAEGN